jgi:hypothetical protein
VGSLFIAGRIAGTGSDTAIELTDISIGKDIDLSVLEAIGKVDLTDAQVGLSILLGGTSLSEPGGGPCLVAKRAQVGSDLRFSAQSGHATANPLIFDTSIDFSQMKVAGLLEVQARYRAAPGARPNPDLGAIVLDGVATRALDHDLPASTSSGQDRMARLSLDGTTYDVLKPTLNARSRLRWLTGSIGKTYRPQPYEQLAAHYRSIGNDHAARGVLLAKRRAELRARSRVKRIFGAPAVAFMDALTGHGYRPGRAVGWLAAGLLAGFAVFSAYPVPGIAPSPYLTALLTLDVLVPTSPFGLEDKVPVATTAYWAAAALQSLGWVLSIAALAVITRVLSRERQ